MSESGLSFIHPDRDTSEQANNMVSEYEMTGRHEGWKYTEGEFDAALTIEQTLHTPVNRLAGSTWGTSSLQPLTRILDLKGNIEVNLDHLVTRYLVTAITRVLPFLPRFSMYVSTNLALTNLFRAL